MQFAVSWDPLLMRTKAELQYINSMFALSARIQAVPRNCRWFIGHRVCALAGPNMKWLGIWPRRRPGVTPRPDLRAPTTQVIGFHCSHCNNRPPVITRSHYTLMASIHFADDNTWYWKHSTCASPRGEGAPGCRVPCYGLCPLLRKRTVILQRIRKKSNSTTGSSVVHKSKLAT